MDKFLAYWRRGWWAWLLALCLNFSLMPIILPAAFAFSDRPTLYWTVCLGLWLVLGAPVWGWLFEVFASNSARIGAVPKSSNGSPPPATAD
jgi:hypothetical protein